MKLTKAHTMMQLARTRVKESRHYRNVSKITFMTPEDPTNTDYFHFDFESNLPINEPVHRHNGEIAQMSFWYDIPGKQFFYSFDNNGYTHDVETLDELLALIQADEELYQQV
jgi:hypothetical protein